MRNIKNKNRCQSTCPSKSFLNATSSSLTTEKSLKLTHWPSMYKNGITLIKLRKSTPKSRTHLPLSFSNNKLLSSKPNLLNLKSNPNIAKNVYCKRSSNLTYFSSPQLIEQWTYTSNPKVAFKLTGKSLMISEQQQEKLQVYKPSQDLKESISCQKFKNDKKNWGVFNISAWGSIDSESGQKVLLH